MSVDEDQLARHQPLKIQGCTVAEALRFGTARLAMSDDFRTHAARDAQQILEIATGLTCTQMLAQPERLLREEEAGAFQGMLAQRRGGVPIQHLRGSQEFFGREFLVSPDVLIPRPETEHLVEEVLRLYTDRSAPLRIADVGTGSGILAITLALEYPCSSVLALDISAAALAMAHTNAVILGARNVRFAYSDLLAAACDERFDLIVSNPPYIPLNEAVDLHPQVREHEPHLALFGGHDGLDLYRRLIPQAKALLRPGSWLLLETAGRSTALDLLMQGWHDLHYVRDLQMMERIAAVRALQPARRPFPLFLRPCFLVVDREFAGSISTRKLVIETAKFNVITAYHYREAVATLERFPKVQAVVVTADRVGESEAFLKLVRERYPEIKRVVTGEAHEGDGLADRHVESFSPEKLLEALRDLFPEPAAVLLGNEVELQKETGRA